MELNNSKVIAAVNGGQLNGDKTANFSFFLLVSFIFL